MFLVSLFVEYFGLESSRFFLRVRTSFVGGVLRFCFYRVVRPLEGDFFFLLANPPLFVYLLVEWQDVTKRLCKTREIPIYGKRVKS